MKAMMPHHQYDMDIAPDTARRTGIRLTLLQDTGGHKKLRVFINTGNQKNKPPAQAADTDPP